MNLVRVAHHVDGEGSAGAARGGVAGGWRLV